MTKKQCLHIYFDDIEELPKLFITVGNDIIKEGFDHGAHWDIEDKTR